MMTQNQFGKELNISGGQFDFETERYEGMVGVSPSSIIIWSDGVGFGESKNDEEPKYISEYESVN